MRCGWFGLAVLLVASINLDLRAQEALPPASPLVRLGRPIPLAEEKATVPVLASDTSRSPHGFNQKTDSVWQPTDEVRRISYNVTGTAAASSVVPAQNAPVPPPPTLAPAPPPPVAGISPAEQYNCGVATAPAGTGWWEGTKEFFSGFPWIGRGHAAPGGHSFFESDHCFDGFISPVTNPFLFEDPRALTEVRPIFIWQQTPTRNPVFHGGDVEFFGFEARLALAERFSIVLNELGLISSEPHHATGDFQNHVGFAQVRIGPQFTFLRSEDTGTLGAVGLTFEIPTGDRRVLQDTGSLSLVPYISLGQSFLRSSYGTFNALATIGYDVGVDDKRSDAFFTSWHLDYDVANLKKIYPLVELHWFQYTSNGKREPVNFEGRDLFNFGSEHVAGHGEVAIAVGARYKFTERLQIGGAYEIPVTTHRDLQDFRITFDMIFRY